MWRKIRLKNVIQDWLCWQSADPSFKCTLRLAWKPNFLLKAIFNNEMKKLLALWYKKDLITTNLAEEKSKEKFNDILELFNSTWKYHPFVLYIHNNNND